MTRDELLDRAVGKCVPIRTENWGLCETHNVGWGPGAFGNGRCWKVADEIKAIEIVLFFLGSEVEALPGIGLPHTVHKQGTHVKRADVLALIDGTDR